MYHMKQSYSVYTNMQYNLDNNNTIITITNIIITIIQNNKLKQITILIIIIATKND